MMKERKKKGIGMETKLKYFFIYVPLLRQIFEAITKSRLKHTT